MEEWRDFNNFPNHQFSSEGRIRHKKKRNILSPHIDKDGYEVASLGSVDNVKVHRVICEVFHGSPKGEKKQVNHIDCNRSNNRADNLEWVSASENIKWGVDYGYVDPSIGLKKAVEANQVPVRIVELDREFPSVKACAEFLRVNPNKIPRVLKGERKGQLLHGYHLEYVGKE